MVQSVSPDPQKRVAVVPIAPPPAEQRVSRGADFARDGAKKTRYSLPDRLNSSAPVGYRTRVPLTRDELQAAVPLMSLRHPAGFADAGPDITEQELFEESALGVLVARQSTNYRGQRQVTLGPERSAELATLLKKLGGRRGEVFDNAQMSHVVLTRPYRTPFTMLLTFIGHQPVKSLLTVPLRGLRKKLQHTDDIPTITYLQHLHLGILADAMERASLIASGGQRRAQVHIAPFCGADRRRLNRATLREIEALIGLTAKQRRQGWRVGLVAQVGTAVEADRITLPDALWRKLGANLMAFRSERVQPGVNAEPKAPPAYQQRQDMTVPDELVVMAGRAAYNAFAHWSGCDRERAKDLMLLERVDVLTPGGKERLREIRKGLGVVTDIVVKRIPKWADLPLGKALSRNVQRGKKAFALAGQRIYIGGLSKTEMAAEGIEWDLAVAAFGATASRSGLVAELTGCVELPDDCDLLCGVCLMAGPVNQNDIGKTFYGIPDLLMGAFPDRDPTSLLVWTLKAKTVADPIGNEEQLLNADRKGALVDLRAGPHDVVSVDRGGRFEPLRKRGDAVNAERAFADVGNFVTSPTGEDIPGNRGEAWPDELSSEALW